MDPISTLQTAKELGIALVAVLGSGYLLKLAFDRLKEQSIVMKHIVDELMIQLQENRKDYSNFVESNNHANSERIEKSTEAMTKVGVAIDTHTKAQDGFIIALNRLVDRIDGM